MDNGIDNIMLKNETSQTITEQMRKAVEVTITPSGLEINDSKFKEKKAVEDKYNSEVRPKGNIFGTVMHRFFELYVNERRKNLSTPVTLSEEQIDKMIYCAILENSDEITERYSDKATVEMERYQAYLKKLSQGNQIVRELDELLADAEEVYTELPFSYYIENGAESFFATDKALSEIMEKKKENFSLENQLIWVNGIADLVIKTKDGKIVIADYKSDNLNGKNEDEIKEHLKKYDGQMRLYVHSMGMIFGVEKEMIDTRFLIITDLEMEEEIEEEIEETEENEDEMQETEEQEDEEKQEIAQQEAEDETVNEEAVLEDKKQGTSTSSGICQYYTANRMVNNLGVFGSKHTHFADFKQLLKDNGIVHEDVKGTRAQIIHITNPTYPALGGYVYFTGGVSWWGFTMSAIEHIFKEKKAEKILLVMRAYRNEDEYFWVVEVKKDELCKSRRYMFTENSGGLTQTPNKPKLKLLGNEKKRKAELISLFK